MTTQNTFLGDVQNALTTKGHSWTAGETSLTPLGPDELKNRSGYTPASSEHPLDQRSAMAKENLPQHKITYARVPTSVDWRNKDGNNYLDPIENQGNCNSCVAFGTTAMVSARARILKGIPANASNGATIPPLSKGQLFYCYARMDGMDCQTGWAVSDALKHFVIQGVVPASYFPYSVGDQSCKPIPNNSSLVTRIKSSNTLSTISEMKQDLSEYGPLVSAITFYEDLKTYQTGVYVYSGKGKSLGGHCIAVVGYDDEKPYKANGKEQKGAWLCRNSWGATWGEEGYFWIAYGQCGIDSVMWSLTEFAQIYEIPKLK